MGVRLFTRLLKTLKFQSQDLARIAAAHKQQTNQPLVILVDALSVCFTLCCDLEVAEPTWSNHALCHYDVIHERLQWLELGMRKLNIELRWYFDSSAVQQLKKEESHKRSQQHVDALVALNQYFVNPSQYPLSKHNGAILPAIITQQFQDSLQSLGAKIHICIGEADPCLARDACVDTQIQGQNPVFGILSSDSDFAFVRGIRYLPLSSLMLVMAQTQPSRQPGQPLSPVLKNISFDIAALRRGATPNSTPVKARNKKDSDAASSPSPSPPTPGSPPASSSSSASASSLTNTSSTEFNYNAFMGSLVGFSCQVLDTVQICAQLSGDANIQFPPSRLSELAIVCGNDFTKTFMNRLDMQRIVSSPTLPMTKHDVEKLVTAYFKCMEEATEGEMANTDDSSYTRIPLPELWVKFLLSLPANEPLEEQAIFHKILKRDEAFKQAIVASRAMYDEPQKYSEITLPNPITAGWQIEGYLSYIIKAVRLRALPASVLSVLHQSPYMAGVSWERIKLDDTTHGFFTPNDAAAATPQVKGIRLPSLESVSQPLRLAIGLLNGFNALRMYARTGTEYRRITVETDGFRAAIPSQAIPVFFALLSRVMAQQPPVTNSPLPLPPFLHMPAISLTDRWSLLECLVYNPGPHSMVPIVKQNSSLQQEFLGGVPPHMRFIVLLTRYVLNAFYHSDVDFTDAESLRMDDPAMLQRIWIYMKAFIQSAFVLYAVSKAKQSSNKDYQIIIANQVFQPATAATPIALPKENQGSVDISTIHFFTILQSTKRILQEVLTYLQLSDHPTRPTSPLTSLPVPMAAELFHGPLYAFLVNQQLKGKGGAANLASFAVEGFIKIRAVPVEPAPLSSITHQFAQMSMTQPAAINLPVIVPQDCTMEETVSMLSTVEKMAEGVLQKVFQVFIGAKHVHRNPAIKFTIAPSNQVQAIVPSHPAFQQAMASSSSSQQAIGAIPPPPNYESMSYPAAVSGGFRPLSEIDVLPIDKLLPSIYHRVQAEPITIVQAATGSGKSSRIPATMVREWYEPARVKQRDIDRAAFLKSYMARAGISKDDKFTLPERDYPPKLRKHPLIVVTQPRRIAAISLAKRVASELGEEVGNTVGFKIGHESVSDNKKTRLLFVTSGWLLQKLVHHPGFLLETTNVVLDEIHERGLDSDILYVILKRILRAIVLFDRKNQQSDQKKAAATMYHSFPSMVLMSATFSTGLFGTYFAEVFADVSGFKYYANPNNLHPIQIDTRRYPVAIYHLEQVFDSPVMKEHKDFLNRLLPDSSMSGIVSQLVGKMSKAPPPGSTQVVLGPVSNSLLHLLTWLVKALALIHMYDMDEGNCILIFFPGLQEIEAAAQMLDETLLETTFPVYAKDCVDPDTNESYVEYLDEADLAPDWKSDSSIRHYTEPMSSLVELMILHSVCEDQLKIFEPVPGGISRVILATNIAESSVTIPNVKYVIDLGAHKEVEFNHKFQCEMLVKKWISQASAAQRAGRCGRLCEGTVFRLFPSAVFNNQRIMAKYDTPELLRVSLASTILRLKMTADESEEQNEAKEERKGKKADGDEEKRDQEQRMSDQRFDPSVCNLNDPHSVLRECMQPPELSSIDAAYGELIKNNAIELQESGGMVKQVSRFQNAAPERAKKQKGSRKQLDSDSDGSDDDDLFEAGISAEQRRKIYTESTITPLGQFFAALPFSFHLSRLVALGVVFGPRYLVHSVVISSALSMTDVFLQPMQSRGAQGGGVDSSGGGGKGRKEEQDPFPEYVHKTTKTRMWADAGICSDAIAIIRVVDAYLKYRQFLASDDYRTAMSSSASSAATGRNHMKKSYLLNDWCAERGIHMKRIKTLTSTISEICYRLSGLVQKEDQKEALLQLAAFCGKSKSKEQIAASNARNRGKQSSQQHQKGGRGRSNLSSAAYDRDSDRGNTEHDDLYHLIKNVAGSADANKHRDKYDHRRDLMSTNIIPDDLLKLDPESVAVLQFMLASSLLPNLFMGSVAPGDLSKGLSYEDDDGSKKHMNAYNTYCINAVPSVLLLQTAQSAHVDEDDEEEEEESKQKTFADSYHEFSQVASAISTQVVSLGSEPHKKKNKHAAPAVVGPIGSIAFEFKETDEKVFNRYRVCLQQGDAATLLATATAAGKQATLPVLTMPTLEMLVMHRMFNNGRLNVLEKHVVGQGSSALSQKKNSGGTSTTTTMHVLSEPKIPGKGIKWRLFSPRSPARLDQVSPISAVTAANIPVTSLKQLPRTFSDLQSEEEAKKESEKEDKKKPQNFVSVPPVARNEFQIFGVAAAMTVSSGVAAEIRGEKFTLLPVGANAGLTSVYLSILLQGEYIVTAIGSPPVNVVSGIKFEERAIHFPSAIPVNYASILEKMRSRFASILNEEFVGGFHPSQSITPMFLQLIRPFILSTVKEYPTTDPVGYHRRTNRQPVAVAVSGAKKMLIPSNVLAKLATKPAAAAAAVALEEKFKREREELVAKMKQKRDGAESYAPASGASSAASSRKGTNKDKEKRSEKADKEPQQTAEQPAQKNDHKQSMKVKVSKGSKPSQNNAAESRPTPAQATHAAPSSSSAQSADTPKSAHLGDAQLLSMLRTVLATRKGSSTKLSELGTLFTRQFKQLWKDVCATSISKFCKAHAQVFQIDGDAVVLLDA